MTTKEKMLETVRQLIQPLFFIYFIVAAVTFNEPKPGISLGELMVYIPTGILVTGAVLALLWILFLAFENWVNKIIDIWVK